MFATWNVIHHARILFFSEDRIRNGAKKLTKARHSSTQGRLDNFFKVIQSPTSSTKRKVIVFWIFLMSDFITFNSHSTIFSFYRPRVILFTKNDIYHYLYSSNCGYPHKNDYGPFIVMGILVQNRVTSLIYSRFSLIDEPHWVDN